MLRKSLGRMEVWGGLRSAGRAVESGGVNAWIYSSPRWGAESQEDLCYVSSCATGRITRLLILDIPRSGQTLSSVAAQVCVLVRRHVNRIDQSPLMYAVNRRCARAFGKGRRVNALATTFFAPTAHLSLCNLGHPPPLLYRAATRQWSLLDQRSAGGDAFADTPPGAIDLHNYDQFDLPLAAGDLVLCYTDVLIESLDRGGAALGLDGLLELARATDTSNPARVIPQLLAALRSRSGRDDGPDQRRTIVLLSPNEVDFDVPLRDRVLAPARMMKNLLDSVQGGEPMAWPEWSLANVGGALFGPLNQLWARSRAGHLLGTARYPALPQRTARPAAPAAVARRPALVEAVVAAAVDSRVAVQSAGVPPLNVNSAA